MTIEKIGELNLPGPVSRLGGLAPYRALRLLVRYHGEPVGWLRLDTEGAAEVSAERIGVALRRDLPRELVRAAASGVVLPAAASDPVPEAISVVVCTRDRADSLRTCLGALFELDYPHYEIIVVDNAPSSHATREYVEGLPVVYVREERPGLDWARNCGVATARHDIVAFADDDTRPDRLWLRALNGAFADPCVAGVTGLVAPMELESWAQRYFEDVYGGMGKGFRRRRFDAREMSSRDLLWSSRVGVGANMAFRRDLFAAVGGFDVALDVGTATRGGGDIEFFHRVLSSGYTMIYEPGALVWHRHRLAPDALKRQLWDNGCAFGAYLRACARRGTVTRAEIARFVVREWMWGWFAKRLLRPRGHSRRLILVEMMGMLGSVAASRQAGREARQIAAGSLGVPAEVRAPVANH